MVKYEAPKLMKLGTVAALTSSDLKCTIGVDQSGLSPYLGSSNEWHWVSDGSDTWAHYSNGEPTGRVVGPQGFADLILSGDCVSAKLAETSS